MNQDNLAWNFAEEIMKKQLLYQKNGDRFIISTPHLKLL